MASVQNQMFHEFVRRTVAALKDDGKQHFLGARTVDVLGSKLLDASRHAQTDWNGGAEFRRLVEMTMESALFSIFSKLLKGKDIVTLDYIYDTEFTVTMDEARKAIVEILTNKGVEEAGCVVDRALSWLVQAELLQEISEKEVYKPSKQALAKIAVELRLVNEEEARKREVLENVLGFLKQRTTDYAIGYRTGQ
ncbi:MAG: hypothetical protein HZA83_00775, partial [Thaumarchaeota archaeon]|nr:hypothetical protein [Nitrososphaerota archaeon]